MNYFIEFDLYVDILIIVFMICGKILFFKCPRKYYKTNNNNNNIKARINKTQQNSKCRLCGDRDETINHLISECSKSAQKEYCYIVIYSIITTQ